MFDWEEVAPQPRLQTCGHCGRTMGDYAGGYAMYNAIPLCDPLGSLDRPNCYAMVSREHHHIPCDHDECVADREERGF